MTCIDCDSEDIYKCEDGIPICRACLIDHYNLKIDLEIEDLL